MGPADLCGWPSQGEVSFPIFSELDRALFRVYSRLSAEPFKGGILGVHFGLAFAACSFY